MAEMICPTIYSVHPLYLAGFFEVLSVTCLLDVNVTDGYSKAGQHCCLI